MYDVLKEYNRYLIVLSYLKDPKPLLLENMGMRLPFWINDQLTSQDKREMLRGKRKILDSPIITLYITWPYLIVPHLWLFTVFWQPYWMYANEVQMHIRERC